MNLKRKAGIITALLFAVGIQAQDMPFRKAEIKEMMKKVADWQIAHPNKGAEHGDLSWTNAVLYVGMLDWAELAEREDGTDGNRTRECIMPTTSLSHRLLSTFIGNTTISICLILPSPVQTG